MQSYMTFLRKSVRAGCLLCLLVLGLFLTCFATLSFAADAKSEAKKVFRVGIGICDVSPTDLPVPINGLFQLRYYEKVHDPLNVRAIAVDDGTTQFVFATVDTCLFMEPFANEIKRIVHEKTGFPIERISISATHTHYTPTIPFGPRTSPQSKYTWKVIDGGAQAIVMAIKNLQPANVGWAIGREPRHVFCRRILMKPGTAKSPNHEFTGSRGDMAQMNPGRGANNVMQTGIPDQSVYVLAFTTPDGKPLAVLANYSTHYARCPNEISASYFGVFARKMAELLKAPKDFLAIMTNGTSGDTNSSDFFDPNQYNSNLDVMGNDVAQAAFKAYKTIEFKDWLPVTACQEKLTLAVRKPTAKQVELAKAWLKEVKEKNKPFTLDDSYARRTISLSTVEPTRTIILQTIRIGDMGICTYPGEVFSFTGHDLRAYSPFKTTFVISHANGNNGYLPTAEQFYLGGYTTWRGLHSKSFRLFSLPA